ncbi:MAG: DUF2225 domain-containing protein [Spirochaetes bacterium]|nr:DUF2225 domain-containing protein [Spirochaetota bacterium]
MEDDKKNKVTFILKNDISCPVCGTDFKREELLTGRGRLIAGNITGELRRLYEPSKVYGKVNPLLYPVTVCPNCFFSAFHEDFSKLKVDGVEKAKVSTEKRKGIIDRIFKNLDFKAERKTQHGAASYILAAECYDYFDKWSSPTIKKAISSLRAAWILSDLEVEDPLADFGNLQNLFYKKALQYYIDVLIKQEKALESFDGIKHLGPDTDVNYGYDGVLYLIGSLTLKNSFFEKDSPEKITNLEKSKKVVSKMFGFGKVSKEKPSILLDMARDLYDELSRKIEELKEKLQSSPAPENN